jgi:dTDP-4-dehydrorhamnose reductase
MIRLVIIGFGFSAEAIAGEIAPGLAALHVTVRSEEKARRLRTAGLVASVFDGGAMPNELAATLDDATDILVSAPPGEAGDPLLAAPGFRDLGMAALCRVIYLSTVGVYGDHRGAWVSEETAPAPSSPRSRQRLVAEEAWRRFAGTRNVGLGVFRLSGIYGPGRSAIDNLRAGTARRIIKPGQVFNRIHVADIAGAVALALQREGPLGTFNLTDDEPCPPQAVVEEAARMIGVEPPPEIPFEAADLSAMARSFYSENKRVSNARIKSVLGYRFRYPTYREGLAACLGPGR